MHPRSRSALGLAFSILTFCLTAGAQTRPVGSRSQARVQFRNEMSGTYRLTRAVVLVDGQVRYRRQSEAGAPALPKDLSVDTGTLSPGSHTIQLALTLQARSYGVLSYLNGYNFEVRSSHAFMAAEGKNRTVTATAFERGGVTTPLERRPAVAWHEAAQALGAR